VLRRISIIMRRMPFPFSVAATRGFVRGVARLGMARDGNAPPYHLHGSRDERRVALTFDDGPAPGTDIVLEKLGRHRARATFFVVGNRLERYGHFVRRAAADGHEIGNHSWNHQLRGDWFTGLGQLAVTNAEISRTIGVEPQLFRPPYGHIPPSLARTVNAAGLAAVGWDVDPADWEDEEPETVAEHALAAACGGSIILLHDGPQMTPARIGAILDGLLPGLAAQGLECVTVSELLQPQLDGSAVAVESATRS
jgi:peptidoglycan/xylan/chitin deacetylase (PgdA/CDA1 family)